MQKLDKAARKRAMSTLGAGKKRAGVMPSKKPLFSPISMRLLPGCPGGDDGRKLDHHPEWSNVYKTVE